MRLLPLSLSLAFIIGLFLAAPASSQEEKLTYERAYQDYTYNYDIYRRANSEYESFRLQYIQYQTLTAQENAREATVRMLQARDEVVKTYLTALRTRLSETGGILDDKRASLNSQIDASVLWFAEDKDKIPSAGSLDDLVKDSDEAAAYYTEKEYLLYDTLVSISIGKIAFIREKQGEVLEEIKAKVGEIRTNGDKDTAVLERWILDTENRLTRSREKEVEALELMPKLKGTQGKLNLKFYDDVLFKLSESSQYLKDANSYMKEIVNEIKFED
jgi:hypothetical protein